MDWQPIETAPKDEWILLAGETSRTTAGQVVGRWAGDDAWESSDDAYGAYISPTHWMPLPNPPKP